MEALRGGIRLGMIKGIRGGWLPWADGWGELQASSYKLQRERCCHALAVIARESA